MCSLNDFVIGDGVLVEYTGKDSIVKIPEGVTRIGNDAFRNCESLKSIIIPNSVKSIGATAFIYCSCLNSMILPNSVTNIGRYAFEDTPNLKDVYYTGTKTEWGNIEFDNEFEDNRLKKWYITIHYNSSIDGISLLKIEEEVSELLSEGKSEKEVYSVLKNKNIPTNDIIKAFSKVKPDSKMLSSFCDKVIIPNILSIFNKEKGISEYTVGGVAKMLYEKYPENLVNKAIVSVLREQYLVD